MKTLKTVQTSFQAVESCRCNRCGQEMVGSMGNVCGAEICIEGCYESPVLDDCTSYEFDLCEHCLSELFEGFYFSVKKIEHAA